MSRSNCYNSILEQMEYDEGLQVAMFKSKAFSHFTGSLAHLNENKSKKEPQIKDGSDFSELINR